MPSPTWTFTGSLPNTPRSGFGYSVLQNGKVLIAGGDSPFSSPTALPNATLYDPMTGIWTDTGFLNTARRDVMSVTLQNGKVLIVSGADTSNTPLTSCELYDPTAATWTFTGSLSVPRQGIIPVLLSNGKVLVTCGNDGGSVLSTAEIYDPVAGTWSITTGAPIHSRSGYSAVVLGNGKVLIAGGESPIGTSLSTCELYDPTTDTFSTTGSMAFPHANLEVGDNDCCLLQDGTALWAGGISSAGTTAAKTSEVYDPVAGTWGHTALMASMHDGSIPIVLGNGLVLLATGHSYPPVSTTELYDPIAVSWSITTSPNTPRVYAAFIRLSSNIVLMAAGDNAFSSDLVTAELFNYGGVIMGTLYSVDGTTGNIVTAGSITAAGGITSNTTTSGFLLPRLTTTQRNAIVSPTTGLEIFNTTTNEIEFYNGTIWTAVGGGTPGSTSGAVQFNASGSLGGDAAKFFWDDTNFRLGIGTNTPAVSLDVVGDISTTTKLNTNEVKGKTTGSLALQPFDNSSFVKVQTSDGTVDIISINSSDSNPVVKLNSVPSVTLDVPVITSTGDNLNINAGLAHIFIKDSVNNTVITVNVGGSLGSPVPVIFNTALDMSTSNKIIHLADPTAAQDAATKNYVDTNFLMLTGGTLTGNLTLANEHAVLFQDTGSNTVTLEAPTTITSSYTLKLPIAQSSGSQVLTNDGSGNLSWTTSGGSSSLNLVYANATGEVIVSTGTDTFIDLQATITPSSNTKKVLVRAVVMCAIIDAGAVYFDFKISRDGGVTFVYVADRIIGDVASTGQIANTAVIEWLDSPATSSPVTYGIYARSEGSGIRLDINSGNNASSITLMEV